MNQILKDKRIFSGIQPSGKLTIGNYYGAIKNWLNLQNDKSCENIYMIADMHLITVNHNPEDVKRDCYNLLAMMISCGIDPHTNPIFVQSQIPAHSQLHWILSCNTYFGEMSRMTQFKQKSLKHSSNINIGLFTYPILMASDILLYEADIVPVGDDQKQHVEITRDLAIRFNTKYGKVFKIPEPFIGNVGSRIMSLQNPSEKMSKSCENANASIFMLDSEDEIMLKFKKSVTDSENLIKRGKGKEGIENLMTIYGAITSKNLDEIETELDKVSYSKFKEMVAQELFSELKPIQNKFREIIEDLDYLNKILKQCAEKLIPSTEKVIKEVYEKIGFIA